MSESDSSIQRISIELGTKQGLRTVIEIYPRTQTVGLISRWPSGEVQAFERYSLETFLVELNKLVSSNLSPNG